MQANIGYILYIYYIMSVICISGGKCDQSVNRCRINDTMTKRKQTTAQQ